MAFTCSAITDKVSPSPSSLFVSLPVFACCIYAVLICRFLQGQQSKLMLLTHSSRWIQAQAHCPPGIWHM